MTPKQQRFVEEYVLDLDLGAAYRRAGFKPKSDEAARTAAWRLLRNVTVREAVQAGLKARSERVAIDADYVLVRLAAESERQGEGASHSARVRALELLGRHLGMFPDRHQHGGDPRSPPIRSEPAAPVYPIDRLNLPLEVRRILLDAIQRANEADGQADGRRG